MPLPPDKMKQLTWQAQHPDLAKQMAMELRRAGSDCCTRTRNKIVKKYEERVQHRESLRQLSPRVLKR
jgi:hypothetical protein